MKRCFYLALGLITAIAIIITIKVGFFTSIANAENVTFYYPEVGEIVGFNEKTDAVFVKTSDGNVWEFAEIDDWMVGDNCCMVFCDNGTADVKDDTIVSVRYFA